MKPSGFEPGPLVSYIDLTTELKEIRHDVADDLLEDILDHLTDMLNAQSYS